jgi:hypothetical protein
MPLELYQNEKGQQHLRCMIIKALGNDKYYATGEIILNAYTINQAIPYRAMGRPTFQNMEYHEIIGKEKYEQPLLNGNKLQLQTTLEFVKHLEVPTSINQATAQQVLAIHQFN